MKIPHYVVQINTVHTCKHLIGIVWTRIFREEYWHLSVLRFYHLETYVLLRNAPKRKRLRLETLTIQSFDVFGVNDKSN